MTEFSKRAIFIIQHIPFGKVTSYSKIATLAGNPKGARLVSRLLSSCSLKYDLPWYRVIGSDGEIAFRHLLAIEEQKARLEKEGVVFQKHRIQDNSYFWQISNLEQTGYYDEE
jgi:methylated-DNA-protein-cysteine methyltransferase-like protein